MPDFRVNFFVVFAPGLFGIVFVGNINNIKQPIIKHKGVLNVEKTVS